MMLHDTNQSLVIETTFGNPRGKLAVPNKSVAVDLKLILLCVRSVAIRILESKVAARWLDGLPLHRVLWSERVELLLDDFAFAGLVAKS